MIKVCALTLYGSQAASTRYRVEQYIEGLQRENISVEVYPLLDNDYLKNTFKGESKYKQVSVPLSYIKRIRTLMRQREFDLAFVHVELFPFLPGLIEAKSLCIPYVYDMDDAFFLKYQNTKSILLRKLLKNKFDYVVRGASAVLAGNVFLKEYADARNKNTVLLPTVVDMRRYVAEPAKKDEIFTVGWVGSPSTSIYLDLLRAPLELLARERPIRFLVIGADCPPMLGVDVLSVRWSEEAEIPLINSIDVGVMPLFDDDWARGKCAFKLIQYMACGLPVVASPVGANKDVVNKESGILAGSSDEWVAALRLLRDHPALRLEMGMAARKRIVAHYSLEGALPTMANVLRSAVQSNNLGADR